MVQQWTTSGIRNALKSELYENIRIYHQQELDPLDNTLKIASES